MLKGEMMKTKNVQNIICLVIFSLLSSAICYAETLRFGDWQVDLSFASEMTEAFTVNDSGSIFGAICVVSKDRCFYYVSPQVTCKEDDSSAVLINSDAGALSSTIICTKIADSYYSIIQETQNLLSLTSKSKNIGFAFPLADGKFKVVRFSLVGANDAILAAANKPIDKEKKRDQTL